MKRLFYLLSFILIISILGTSCGNDIPVVRTDFSGTSYGLAPLADYYVYHIEQASDYTSMYYIKTGYNHMTITDVIAFEAPNGSFAVSDTVVCCFVHSYGRP